jgi:hypothetical protein
MDDERPARPWRVITRTGSPRTFATPGSARLAARLVRVSGGFAAVEHLGDCDGYGPDWHECPASGELLTRHAAPGPVNLPGTVWIRQPGPEPRRARRPGADHRRAPEPPR